jgi:ribonuclease E
VPVNANETEATANGSSHESFEPRGEDVEHTSQPYEPAHPVATDEPTREAAPQPEQNFARPSEPDVGRRRSTVRERVIIVSEAGEINPTSPQPVIPNEQPAPPPEASSSEDSDKPRRTGWWAKRLLGG